ncbi:hypothetical protein [Flagellimonas nanhaiensis]|uniref:PorT family protein n=1 Tax=Flagellimonas nanhaiensis TaxID=2292706 RepID=A0A371JNS0_9FLAO|nr:hypothetical protein [Allomuricauda nanhaiensis]RDY58872.1 hypothetical protein DX873_14525 [Allomuricauda nanhaiensis]
MRSITQYLAVVLVIFISQNVLGQEKYERQIERLNAQKENIEIQEKQALKQEVKDINRRMEKGDLTLAEAKLLKAEVAKKRALNIEERIAIIDNKISLLQRNEGKLIEVDSLSKDEKFALELDNDDDFIFGIHVSRRNRNVKYDKKTYSDLVLAFGLNNALIHGESFADSPYKFFGSRFFEIGYAWNTRVFRNKGWLRFKYGFSFQFNGLKPTENRFFDVDIDEFGIRRVNLTTLPDENGEPRELFKSKYRMDSFIIPLHLEFGEAEKKEYGNYTRFDKHNNFKFGIGGYFGFNYSNRQKVFIASRKDLLATYATGNNSQNRRTIFGLSSYAGFGDMSLYFKYELTQIFDGPSVKQNNVSLGLRFDL